MEGVLGPAVVIALFSSSSVAFVHYADTMILAGIYRRLRRSVSRTLTRPGVLRIDNLEFAGPGFTAEWINAHICPRAR